MRNHGEHGRGGGSDLKIHMPGGLIMETNPLEWMLYLQMSGITEDLITGKLTWDQADFKLKFLINLYGFVVQEAKIENG